jgi:histidinol-phosphate aminotransferase
MSPRIPEPRKVVNNFAPYVPGMSIEEVKEKYGLEDIIKLASNENLWGCSPSVRDAVTGELDNLHIYPQSDPAKLREAVAQRYSVSSDSVLAGNGTDEIIELVARTFLEEGDNIVVSENSFVRYKMAGMLMGVEVIEVPQKELTIDLKGLREAVNSKTKIVYVDNPCNPTGTFINKTDVETFMSSIESMDKPPIIFFDEAYVEYAKDSEYESAVRYLKKDIPLIVSRTFSKIYGLAGLRIGYCMADPQIISLVNRLRPPFNTNRAAQAAALAALNDQEFITMVSDETDKEKEFLYSELDRLNIEYVRSQTNFILIKFGSDKVKVMCEYFLKNGIILRPLAGYSLDDYIRITVGKREHNIKLVEAIESFING